MTIHSRDNYMGVDLWEPFGVNCRVSRDRISWHVFNWDGYNIRSDIATQNQCSIYCTMYNLTDMHVRLGVTPIPPQINVCHWRVSVYRS